MDGTNGSQGAGGAQGATGAVGFAGPTGPDGPRGLIGPPGAIGAAGATGAAGDVGLQGLAGDPGVAGDPGTTGDPGTPGDAGATGATGAGVPGADGAVGPEGPVGPDGPAGSDGAAGPPGTSVLPEYAWIYNVGPQTVPVEASVVFDTNSVMSAGITHVPGTAEVTIATAGTYAVAFVVTGLEANQMTLFINGVPVPGTTEGSGAASQQNVGQFILAFTAGDVLTVRNHTSAAAVGLQSLAGGTQPGTNASVRIIRVA